MFFLTAFLFLFLDTSTNDLYFHVYLIEGVVQWNKARSVAVEEGGPLQQYANRLSQKFLGYKLVEDHSSPGEYTGNALHVYTICIYLRLKNCDCFLPWRIYIYL